MMLEGLVMQDRKVREEARQSVPTLRRRGPMKDVPLPRPGAKKLKIPRNGISQKWLIAHEDQDTPSRIAAEEAAAADAENDEDSN